MIPRRYDKTLSHWLRRRSIAAAVAGISLTLVACNSSPVHQPTIPLLPDSVAGQRSWTWTASCPFDAADGRKCADSAPRLGTAQLSGDEWNLGDSGPGQGSVGISLRKSGGLEIFGDLRSAPPCTKSTCVAPSASTWVRGYPSVLYGVNQCSATSPPRSAKLALPTRLSSINNLVGSTSYSSQPARVTFDLAYDIWLNRSGTTTPCPKDGTIEVMVWTDYDQRALLPQSLRIGTGSIPFAVDRVVKSGTSAWSIYAANVKKGGQTAPSGGTVWIVLQRPKTVAAGTISVDLSDALSTVGSLLERNYGWADFDKDYWLDTVSFGTEYGPSSGTVTAAGPSTFSLSLSAYCLDVHMPLSQAAC